tara:strand:+ start:19005 stop:19139 length:135 start_codon:yes stop_codon:yes gene_type:complete
MNLFVLVGLTAQNEQLTVKGINNILPNEKPKVIGQKSIRKKLKP